MVAAVEVAMVHLRPGYCCWSCPGYSAGLDMQYFLIKDLLIGGRMSFVGITDTL